MFINAIYWKNIRRTVYIFCISTLLVYSAAAQEIPKFVTLAKVDYQGLTLFTHAEISAVAGLKLGKHLSTADLDNAAKLLSYWGYFKTVQYDYRYSGAQLSVSFQVQENAVLKDCLFDNFLGFSDQELLSAIQKIYPSFKGKVPEKGTVLQDIAHILEKYISRSGTPRSVNAAPIYKTEKIIFAIENFQSPLCKIDFEGEDKEILPFLEDVSRKLISTPYSRWQIDAYAKQDISSFVKKQGYWKFGIGTITSEKSKTPDCPDGANVRITYDSGGKFIWSGAAWSGNAVKSASELNNLIGLKQGDVASLRAIEAGLTNVAIAYFRNGYLDYTLQGTRPNINYANHEVSYHVAIKEGAPYRMGTFFPVQLPGKNLPVDKLIKQWKIKTGDIFDGAYFDEFKEKTFSLWLQTYASDTGLQFVFSKNKDMTVNLNVYLPAPVPPQKP